ncbi:hypothetical protein [Roseicella aquatilis]|uniref:Uncharacterized protein n=1 Tax=Roseicella aquatilis TaxID=2527868 RepID=A0A4R4DKT4_9PROT|nr:hypothetical protein [Roseicella aquatilis]TCZ61092.1 hypothetical protein EXY23_13250 [Roseicella aquatilis]
MPKHRRRMLMPDAVDAALEAAEACRRAAMDVMRQAPIGGPVYQAASAVMDALDGLAEALTGDRERFWAKPHSTTPHSAPNG